MLKHMLRSEKKAYYLPPHPRWLILRSAAPVSSDIGSVAGNITTMLSSALAAYSVESAMQIIGT